MGVHLANVMFFPIISWLAASMGVVMSLSWFVQAHRIMKRKSADDISLITVIIFMAGDIIWLGYGLLLQDFPIIASFSIGLLGVVCVFLFALKYRSLRRKRTRPRRA